MSDDHPSGPRVRRGNRGRASSRGSRPCRARRRVPPEPGWSGRRTPSRCRASRASAAEPHHQPRNLTRNTMNRTWWSPSCSADPARDQARRFERSHGARPDTSGMRTPVSARTRVAAAFDDPATGPARSAIAVGPRGHTPHAPSARSSLGAVAPSGGAPSARDSPGGSRPVAYGTGWLASTKSDALVPTRFQSRA